MLSNIKKALVVAKSQLRRPSIESAGGKGNVGSGKSMSSGDLDAVEGEDDDALSWSNVISLKRKSIIRISLPLCTMTLLVATLCVMLQLANAFYLPGVAPVDYPESALVDLKVTSMTSTKTQLPFEYYTLPFCSPDKVKRQVENLGEVLRGDRIMNSPYQLFMKVDEKCKVLCSQRKYSAKEVNEFIHRIKDEYRVHWIIDNLPAATPHHYQSVASDKIYKSYTLGFALGTRVDESKPNDAKHGRPDKIGKNHPNLARNKGSNLFSGLLGNIPDLDSADYYLNNHVSITVLYHDTASAPATSNNNNNNIKSNNADDGANKPTSRIVGVEVVARSISHTVVDETHATCDANLDSMDPMVLKANKPADVFWTYDVTWTPTPEIKWASRWDTYLYMSDDDNIHWFAVINSVMIVVFLTGMVAMIFMRTLQQEITKYNQLDDTDDLHEETGWKLVHGDVFRPPSHPMLLSVSVGMGVQVLGMTIVTLLFAVLGFLSPANRGGLLTAVVLLFCLMGVLAGYYSARNYKMLYGTKWRRNVALTAFMYPSVIFAVFFILNFFIWGAHSSGAVPFGTLLILLYLWLGVNTPLVMVGAYFGYKKKIVAHPVRTNQIPRQIPQIAWYVQPVSTIVLGAILPFGAIFIELFFVLSSIWLHTFYYLFGFVLLVFVILVVTCAEIAVVMCYFQLVREDYRWWWRSFLTTGFSAVYVFLYSIFYFYTKLEIDEFVPTMIYFSYTFVICLLFFLFTGTIGYVGNISYLRSLLFYCYNVVYWGCPACFWFVRRAYSSIRVD